MTLVYAVIVFVLLSVATIITGKIIKKNKIVILGIAVLSFVIIFSIGFYIRTLYETDTEYEIGFTNEMNVSTQSEVENKVEISDGKYLNGKIIDITQSYITVQKEENTIKKVKINDTKQFLNARTGEIIETDKIKIGDYFTFNTIVRNIFGEELLLELYKSISNNSTRLYFVPLNIKSIENNNNNYIVTVPMEDGSMDYFEKDNRPVFECQFIINENTKYYPENKNININNLQEMTKDMIYNIYLDEKTINDKNPVISKIDIYDI